MNKELQAKYDQLISKQRELKKAFHVEAQAILKETFKEFFEGNPAIKAIIWTQYTPYFNDGSECVFRVNDAYFTNAEGEDLDNVSSWGEYDGENEEIFCSYGIRDVLENDHSYYKEDADKITAAGGVDVDLCDMISNMISDDEMESVLRDMFGDHTSVIATREGFDVREYEHD